MTTTTQPLIAGFIVPLGLAGFGRTASADPAEPLRITVHVHDYAHVPPAILARAEDEAARIYRAAGVALEWVDESTPSARLHPATMGHSDLNINILSSEMTKGKRTAEDAMGAATGDPEARGRLAYVFYARVANMARIARKTIDPILGHVIAHEIGHLLLPQNSHSPSGVMRATWDSRQTRLAVNGLLRFTPEQAELIRSRVSSAYTQS